MKHTYRTKGTCSTQIEFDLNGDIVSNVEFTGGCNGNLQGISSLVDGLTVEQIESKLKGISSLYIARSSNSIFYFIAVH